MFLPDTVRIDEKTATFLAIALAALMLPRMVRFKIGSVEVDLANVNEQLKLVQAELDNAQKDFGPGSKQAIRQVLAAPIPPPHSQQKNKRAVDPEDPNKGQFGETPESNGRKLWAVIKSDSGSESRRCRVVIRVESTDSARPLSGVVSIHLHPTFGGGAIREIPVKGGVAHEEFVSYGAFTIGARADEGQTSLELDLVDVPGGTHKFYKS